MTTVLIVGAGLAGAAAAQVLCAAGVSVRLVDKGRAVGGRLATRRVTVRDPGGDERSVRFDHGAPAVSAGGSAAFAAALERAIAAGGAARWHGPAKPGDIVGTPAMRDLVANLLAGRAVSTGVTVRGLQRERGAWQVATDGEPIAAERVILTVPAPQCAALLGECAPAQGTVAEAARYDPCWTGMLVLPDGTQEALGTLQPEALAAAGVETLIANGAKPGREGAASLVMHASAAVSTARLEDERETMRDWFVALAREELALPAPLSAAAHRWRYARVAEPVTLPAPYDADLGLGLAGDWTLGPDASDAFQSGVRVAEALLAAR